MLTPDNMPGELRAGEIFHSRGSVQSNGSPLNYELVSEEIVFCDSLDQPEASLVMHAFLLEGAPKERPVLFAIAGGPGASSCNLSLGMYGAKIYDYRNEEQIRSSAPFFCKDNDDWILDTTDIVLIDPVGTGYGKIYQSDRVQKYFGHENDCYALAQAIAYWLEKHDRMNSPKFLNGVSYGGHRCCLVPRYLFGGQTVPGGRLLGIQLNGIIQMGDACLVDTNANANAEQETIETADPIPDLCYTLAGFAAAHWYHHHPDDRTPLEAADEAYGYAMGELLTFLNGDQSDEEERNAAAERVGFYTGLSEDYLLEHNFEIDFFAYCYELALKEESQICGMYDSRYTLPAGALRTKTFDMIADDPFISRNWSAVSALSGEIFRNEYGIQFADGRTHLIQNFDLYSKWDWRITPGTRPIDWQKYNMRHNPDLRLMIVSGLYDLCWNYGYSRYTIEEMGLPPERTELRVYEAGHSMYFDDKARHRMAADFREFIRKSL